MVYTQYMDIDAESVGLTSLRPKHQDFLSAYIDKDSPTYGNATQSYISVYGQVDTRAATAAASRLLSSGSIRSVIERILASGNAGVLARLTTIANIATGLYMKTTIQEHVDPKTGEVTNRTITRVAPSAREIVAAHEMINRMTGVYAQTDIDKHAAIQSIDKLYAGMKHRIKDIE